jgi:hypothetical protein
MMRRAAASPSARTAAIRAAGALLLPATGACAPRARPLVGAPAPAAVRLPRAELLPELQRVVFRWRYEEDGFSARGEGVARVAPPDSARLDFFLDGGFGGGWAVLVGDDVSSPAGDVARRFIPPAPMLWAALGRLAVPSARDTTIRVSGDTLRADVVAPDRTWRVTFAGPRLTNVEQLVGGRVVERLTRDGARVRYTHLVARRALAIDVQRTERANVFPAEIWTR